MSIILAQGWRASLLQAHSPRQPETRQRPGSQAQFSKRRCAFPPDTRSPRDCQGYTCSPPGPKAAGPSSPQSGRDELTSVAIKCIPEKLRSYQGPFYEYGLPLPDQLCGKQPLSLKGQRRNRMAIRRDRGQSFKGSSLPHASLSAEASASGGSVIERRQPPS